MREPRWSGVTPRGEKCWQVIDELVDLDFTLGPTFAVFEVFRDYEGVTRMPWNDEYLHPAIVK